MRKRTVRKLFVGVGREVNLVYAAAGAVGLTAAVVAAAAREGVAVPWLVSATLLLLLVGTVMAFARLDRELEQVEDQLGAAKRRVDRGAGPWHRGDDGVWRATGEVEIDGGSA